MESAEHEAIAKRIARKHGVEYKPERRGPDVQAPARVVEVGVDPARVAEEIRQVRRSTRPRYVAGPGPFARKALRATKGSGVGVMNAHGKVLKRGTRGRKK